MNTRSLTRNRTVAVICGAAILTSFGGVGGAVASRLITSEDIKDGQVMKPDVGKDAVGSSEVIDGSLGESKLNDATRAKIDSGAQKPTPAEANWSIVDRNVIGNGDAYLRSGPSAAPDVKPPLGVGSLGLRTGSAQDKAAFGDQSDFVGNKLGDLSTVKYDIFTTGENAQVSNENLPNLSLEVNPGIKDASGKDITYSTLVYVLQASDATANKWSTADASAAQRWYYTGSAGVATGCNQTTYCTLADAQKAAPNATIYTVQFTKGRDNAFSGAVDKLVLNNTTYDFEPNGVFKTTS